MSEQRSRRFLKNSDEKNGPGRAADQEQATSSKKPEGGVRYSNVRCTRSLLGRGFRKPCLVSAPKTDKENKILEYLDHNKDFLESYVVEKIPLEQLQGWVIKKAANGSAKDSASSLLSPIRYNVSDMFSRKHTFMDLVNKLQGNGNEHSMVWELARFICKTIGVNGYKVYKIFPDHPNFIQYFENNYQSTEPLCLIRVDADSVRNVIEVAKKGICWRLSKDDDSEKFPEVPTSLFASFGLQNVKGPEHVLYQPILSANGKTVYVIEMFRITRNFTEKDEEISSNFVVWGSMILHYCNLYLDKKRERNMSDFLLDVVKSIFEEMVSLDQLIRRILEFAQRLVNADRASLFLVDYGNYELVSTVFDLKFDPGQRRDMEKKEIRMPINRGIAGHVALSGETMNIPDAYSDYRFNREVDEVTGYKTISILCMPIKVQGRVIGVVQMVNKRNNNKFDHEDEVAFEIFASFFGLALHHARLYDKIIRKEQKYKVALEVLSYHNTCKEHELKAMLTEQYKLNVKINDFYLDPYQLDDMEKCKAAINMFQDLFDMSKFNILTLTRFILTVKKNYRTVPYHNFDHGWSVAHAMYLILKSDNNKRFNFKMRLSLFVASLCHDLDHRGYTNKYMSETASPLAAMYTTSTLEHHHFNITVTILQQDGHNIFSHFSSSDYKDILRNIRQCILATDLAVFFPNLEKLNQIYQGKTKHPSFSWGVPGHRDLAMAIAMTAADLSASAKPWEVQIKTVKVIFEEFYDQGDRERSAGKTPIPMMDRNKPDEQSTSQVGFLSQICVPCYSMLYKIFPKTKPMYLMAVKNLNNWKLRASQTEKKLTAGSSFDDVSDSEFDDNDLKKQGLLETDEVFSDSDENEEELSDDVFEGNEEVVEEISSEIQAACIKFKFDSILRDREKSKVTNDSAKQDESWEDDDQGAGAVIPNKYMKHIGKNELEES